MLAVIWNGMSAAWAWIGANHDAIQTILLVFGTIAAFAVIWHNALISRRESTIHMVQELLADEAYERFKTLCLELEAAGTPLTKYTVETSANKATRDLLIAQINQYELVSLAVAKGVFDEGFYKRWFLSQLLRDYERMQPLIVDIRRHFNNEAYWREFERIASRWGRKKHPSKWKMAWRVLFDRRSKAVKAVRTQLPTASKTRAGVAAKKYDRGGGRKRR